MTVTVKLADTGLDDRLFSAVQTYSPPSPTVTFLRVRMLVEVGSSVDVNWLVMDILESLSASLSLLHSRVAGGLATTLHLMMRVPCSSGVAVFPLISTSLAGTTH